jgi:minichromosome maintenance protein 10
VAGGKRDLFLNETVGREAQARAARVAGSRDADMALKKLLARDKDGMKAVQEARRFAKKARAKQIADGHEKRRKEGDIGECGSEEESESDGPSSDKPTKNAYSAQVIKRLGFDPTLKSSRGRRGDDDPTDIYSKVSSMSLSSPPGSSTND